MIIFDYATLADDSHRRHFIDPEKSDAIEFISNTGLRRFGYGYKDIIFQEWQPDYAAYYAAAKDDRPIEIVIKIFYKFWNETGSDEAFIWCDAPNANREVFIKWLCDNCGDIDYFRHDKYFDSILRMRPDGDTTPWHKLKEKWFYEITGYLRQHDPELVFEPSGSPMIEVWKRYAVTVMEVHS